MLYPVTLKKDSDGSLLLRFPDIPEAITSGKDIEDALRHGLDALVTALDFYFDSKRAVPVPSNIKRGQKSIAIPASIYAKVLLHNALIEEKVHAAELARRIDVPRSEIVRMLNPRHATKIDSIEKALAAVGKQLTLASV